MKLAFKDSQVAVFDDVLSPEQAAQLWAHFKKIDYQNLHANRLQDTWRLVDGAPWQGGVSVYSAIDPTQALPPGASLSNLQVNLYPTRTPVDFVFDAVRRVGSEVTELIGTEGQDWVAATGSSFLFPSGTSTAWHADGPMYSGAWILYTHPTWNVLWGGELLVADEDVRAGRAANEVGKPVSQSGTRHIFDNEEENQELSRIGVGRYIIPKPNRLVFISAFCVHAVAKVTPAAGQNVRASISGFFVRQEGIPAVLGEFIKDFGK